MNWIILAITFTTSICFYVGIYYLLLFIRRPSDRVNISFAFTCFAITLYNIFTVGLYYSGSVEQGIFWQRFQYVSLSSFCIAIYWFISNYTDFFSKKISIAVITWFGMLIVLGLTVHNELTLSIDTTIIKKITLGANIRITYYTGEPGIIFQVQYLSMIAGFIFLIYLIIKHFVNDSKKYALPILISLILFFFTALNDMCISSSLYTSIYLMEFSFILIILSMAHVLQDKLIDLFHEVEELNIQLEETIDEQNREQFFDAIGKELYMEMLNDFTALRDLISRESGQGGNRLSRDISIVSDLSKLLDTLLSRIMIIASAGAGYIFLVNEEDNLELKAHKNEIVPGVIDYAADIVDMVFNKGTFIISGNTICLPIQSRGETTGVCFLENPPSESSFTSDDANILTIFLSHAVKEIDNSFLYKEISSAKNQKKKSIITASIEIKIKKALSYIHENYNSDISREALAASLNMHHDSLSRYFKLYTNKKINEYINELRVVEATKKLRETKSSIIEIAFSTGFESLSTFNRAFLKVMKITPTEYREKDPGEKS
ncbi:MAG: helix-turn-helix domain-containing protein [bacterium]|nr:helix-turn-helix domain-containing protein [bacterium]